ncbi:MAG: hypothetical protein ACLFVD_02380 [Dehalococcoidia bacterium]
MPQERNRRSRPQERPLEGKDITPWLAKRFAHLALPLARPSTIGTTALRLTAYSLQENLGYSKLVSRAVDRAGLTAAAWRAAPLTMTSRIVDAAWGAQASVPTRWHEPSSLFLARYLPGQAGGLTHTSRTAADRQSADAGLSWPSGRQLSQRPEGVGGSSKQAPPTGQAESMSPLATEGPVLPAMAVLSPSAPPPTESPPVGGQLLPRGNPDSQSYSYRHTSGMPPDAAQDGSLQQGEVTDAIQPITASPSLRRARDIYAQEDADNADQEQKKGIWQRLTDVREDQQTGLTRLLSRALTPITNRSKLQPGSPQAASEAMRTDMTGQQAPPIEYAYQQEKTRAQEQAGAAPAALEAMIVTVDLPALESSREELVHDNAALSNTTGLGPPVSPLTAHPPDRDRSPARPTIAEEVSARYARSTLAMKHGGPALTMPGLAPARAVFRSQDDEAAKDRPPAAPTLEAERPFISEATADGTASRRETPDTGIGAGRAPDQGLLEAIIRKVPTYRHSLPLARPGVTTPEIASIPPTVTAPSQRLFTATAGEPMYGHSEDRVFPQDHEYAASVPGYSYADQPPPVLPVVAHNRADRKPGITPGQALFRYTSDAMPQLSHLANNNGLELALAQASPVTETKTEAPAKATEPPAEKGEDEANGLDLRALAREIYPLIRRMIMIERDRHPTWY